MLTKENGKKKSDAVVAALLETYGTTLQEDLPPGIPSKRTVNLKIETDPDSNIPHSF